MRYKIEYLSREKDVLLRILEGEEHLADIKNARYIAKTLCCELDELYEELRRCIRALEEKIHNIQMQIGQAQQAARQTQMRASQASAKLASTPTTKTVYPSKEEAANGARPKQVPANEEQIARLKGEIAQCKAEIARAEQRIKELQAKLAPLQKDMNALGRGLDRVDGYLNIAKEADMRLETAYREAEYRCREVVPDIQKISDLMENYDDVDVSPVGGRAVPHIGQKEGW